VLIRSEIAELLQRYNVPGVQMGVVIDGQPGWVQCAGRTACDGGEVTPDTVFHTGSLSKPVAALAVLQLVERGLLTLDYDVTPLLLYDLPWHHTIQDRMRKDPLPVTIRWLLQHRAGVIGRGTTPNAADDAFLPLPAGGGSQRFENAPGVYVPSLSEMWQGFEDGHPFMLTTLPGQQYAYSGAGYTILQHIVEQVTGQDFASYFASEVFPALGATSSTYQLFPPQHWPLATGHSSQGEPLTGKHELAPWSAAGGLFSTVGDLQRILSTMLSGGDNPQGRVLTAGMMHEMLTGELGVMVRGAGDRKHFRHGGDNRGFRALMLGYPQNGNGAIVLTNGQSNDGIMLRERLGRMLIDAL